MKRNKLYVAVTGGIGSGKSTVLHMLSELGYPVFSADEISRNVYSEREVFEKVAELFPQCVERGSVNRKKLADAVFSDQKKLSFLDSITHPVIMRKLLTDMQNAAGEVAFAEVPLLFESGSEQYFDYVVVVMRDERERVRSVMERDGLTEKEVSARIKNQFDYERNPNTGHTVLYNDGNLASLKNSVVRIVNEIIADLQK